MIHSTTRQTKIRRDNHRAPLHARIQLITQEGKPVAPLARCTNISMGGLRVAAAEGVRPGTMIRLRLTLPAGRDFEAYGRIAWLVTTLHPRLLSTPTGRDDDAIFGIAFEDSSTQDLMPIARLLADRDDERRRAARIRRLYGMRVHA